MGSTGSGKFGNYRISGGLNNKGGTFGGPEDISGEVECPESIENIKLQDVATSDFYVNNAGLPPVGLKVQIKDQVYQGRLVVETIDSQEVIGNLPTEYNYLITCIKNGIKYKGQIISSGETPVPFVLVTLYAS